MQSVTLIWALMMFGADGAATKQAPAPFEDFRQEVCAALAKLEPSPKDTSAAEQSLRRELTRIVNKYAAQLRPMQDSARYVSADERFVLVIAANGSEQYAATSAVAEDKHALVVVAIGGDGFPGSADRSGSPAASASATAPRGIAIALGGRGGTGAAGASGGGAGIGDALAAISLGGKGGPGIGGARDGPPGGGDGVVNVRAILAAVKKFAP